MDFTEGKAGPRYVDRRRAGAKEGSLPGFSLRKGGKTLKSRKKTPPCHIVGTAGALGTSRRDGHEFLLEGDELTKEGEDLYEGMDVSILRRKGQSEWLL